LVGELTIHGGVVKAFVLAPLLASVVLLATSFDGESGLPAWFVLRADLAECDERLEELNSEIEVLRAQVVALGSDPFALERAIREDLGLALPGEVVVRFGDGAESGADLP
jgi:cell division protein FtsB